MATTSSSETNPPRRRLLRFAANGRAGDAPVPLGVVSDDVIFVRLSTDKPGIGVASGGNGRNNLAVAVDVVAGDAHIVGRRRPRQGDALGPGPQCEVGWSRRGCGIRVAQALRRSFGAEVPRRIVRVDPISIGFALRHTGIGIGGAGGARDFGAVTVDVITRHPDVVARGLPAEVSL